MDKHDQDKLPANVERLRPTPPPADGDRPLGDRIFWAERDPAVQWRSTAIMLLLMAPLAFFAPISFLAGALAALAMGWWNERGFRFTIDRAALTLRVASLAPTLRLPLAEIAEARVVPDTAALLMPLQPNAGHLLLRKTDGTQLIVPGLKDVAQAVEAIRLLQQDAATGDREQPRAAA